MKRCSKCKKTKSLEEFHKSKRNKFGVASFCKPCANERSRDWRRDNPERCKEQHVEARLRVRYGITPSDYDELFEKQEGLCAICSSPPRDGRRVLDIDHCHSTGGVRGLLCHRCNQSIGKLGDTLESLERATNYLRKYYGE